MSSSLLRHVFNTLFCNYYVNKLFIITINQQLIVSFYKNVVNTNHGKQSKHSLIPGFLLTILIYMNIHELEREISLKRVSNVNYVYNS